MAARALDLADPEKNDNQELASLIRSNIDLLSPYPLAFMFSTGSDPRHAQKHETIGHFQQEAEGYVNLQPFVLDGYPAVEEDGVVLAIDGMNCVHIEVNSLFALTTSMHVIQLANCVVDIPCHSLRSVLRELHIHFDSPDLVPLCKSGEQTRRDSYRNSVQEEIKEGERQLTATPRYLRLDLDQAPPRNWSIDMLSNRQIKSELVNAMAAFSVI